MGVILSLCVCYQSWREEQKVQKIESDLRQLKGHEIN